MPDNVTRPVEGFGLIEFELKLPQNTVVSSNQTTIPILSKITETVFAYNECEISFRVTDAKFHSQILRALNSQGQPVIRFRFGTGDASNAVWVPWQTHYVVNHRAEYEGVGPNTGHYIKLHTKDLLYAVDRISATEGFHGTVSSVVEQLASDNDITDTVIEPTQGQGLWIQSFEGDFEFVRRRLLRRARSTRGRGNYYFFIRDDVLHFHTVEYQTTIKDFNYYSSPGSKLTAFELSQAKIPEGAAGARVVNFDPFTGESKERKSDPSQAIRMGNVIPRLDKLDGGPQRNVAEHRTHSRDDECSSQALAQNIYEYARAESFQLQLLAKKMAIVRPGELLRINIDPSSGSTSSWSGIYLVATATHIIDKGALSSVYVLQRGEQQVFRNNTQDMANYGVDTIQDDQSAPGYDLNLRDIQGSSLTKGAGNNLSTGLYSTVQDANAALKPRM